MTLIRTFIAIKLPESIQAQMEIISQDLQNRMRTRAIRWVSVKNIHLTLKFLGDVSSINIQHLTTLLSGEVPKYPSFELSVGGIGGFPTIHRPRIIWIGIQPPPELFTLQKAIENGTSHLGYQSEDREFSPHFTLARIAQYASTEDVRQIGDILMDHKVGSLGTFQVKEIWLFRSDLLPGGAIYTPLFKKQLSIGDHAIESI
jgi:RNA 2',3'-cyclic 3'-phosphodiesterase